MGRELIQFIVWYIKSLFCKHEQKYNEEYPYDCWCNKCGKYLG
jgi:hypothetical protein